MLPPCVGNTVFSIILINVHLLKFEQWNYCWYSYWCYSNKHCCECHCHSDCDLYIKRRVSILYSIILLSHQPSFNIT